MITYKWTINALDCKIDEEGLENIVQTIHWRYSGTDENSVSAEIYGAQSVGTPNPEDFTPFTELTEEQVTGWLEGQLDMKSMQENISNQITIKVTPVNVVLPTPWNTLVEETL